MDPASKPLRLFFAVPVDESVKAAAAKTQAELKAAGVEARWTDPASLHLTLRFLGDTPKERLPAARLALAALAGAGGFDAAFDRLGSFPGVIWAGVGDGSARLAALAARLADALTRAGFTADERPFQAHLTLGRGERRPPPTGLDWRWRARSVVLYESRLSSRGAVHVPLDGAQL